MGLRFILITDPARTTLGSSSQGRALRTLEKLCPSAEAGAGCLSRILGIPLHVRQRQAHLEGSGENGVLVLSLPLSLLGQGLSSNILLDYLVKTWGV